MMITDKTIEKATYVSPKVETYDVNLLYVLCQSGGINDMSRDPEQELDW